MTRLALLALLLAAAPALAQTAAPSLFFTPDEVAIGERIMAGREPRPPAADGEPEYLGPPPVPPDIHLGALIFIAPGDWVLWVNGQRRTPRDSRGELEIAAVSRDRAEIVWRGDAKAGPLRVRLRPYQTFIGSTGEILEGALAPGK